jgi:hypothetical protein
MRLSVPTENTDRAILGFRHTAHIALQCRCRLDQDNPMNIESNSNRDAPGTPAVLVAGHHEAAKAAGTAEPAPTTKPVPTPEPAPKVVPAPTPQPAPKSTSPADAPTAKPASNGSAPMKAAKGDDDLMSKPQDGATPAVSSAEALGRRWNQHLADARKTWSKLSEAELTRVQGVESKLSDLVQRRYDMTRADASRQVRGFFVQHKS